MVVAMDAMAVAIHIKYALSLNCHFTFYYPGPRKGVCRHSAEVWNGGDGTHYGVTTYETNNYYFI